MSKWKVILERNFLSWVRKSFNAFSEFLIVIGFILLFLILLVAVSVTFSYIRISLNIANIPIFELISNSIISAIAGKPINELSIAQQQSSLLFIINISIFVTTILFAIAPIYTYSKRKKDLVRNKSIKCEIIYKIGEDDLDIMKKYYIGAEYITVFSGDFD